MLAGPKGVVEARLLLDTGAATTLIGEKHLGKAGLDPTYGKQRVSVTMASGIVYAPRLTVSAMTALGLRREDFQVTAHTLPPSAPIDGLLGLDFLVGLRLTPDMRAGELVLEG